jgi:Fic/DOC family
MINKDISLNVTVFHGRMAPEEGVLVGYGAIIESYKLATPLPSILTLISQKKRQYKEGQWQVLTPRHLPEDTLYKHLVFALKYEGVNLLILKKVFEQLSQKEAIELFQTEPLGQYSRRLWFIYEFLLGDKLNIPDLSTGNYIPLLDVNLQYGVSNGEKSKRHRITNNLPGTKDFCPLVNRTEKLDKFIESDFSEQKNKYIKDIRKDILQRASAFLLLKDSKASFSIEGESPKGKRTARWGKAIAQAGSKDLSTAELLRLQQIVIEDERFIEMGLRKKGGFIGDHDRTTGSPIPDHISARWENLGCMIDGLISTNDLLLEKSFDAVLAATIIAFGFVFIHPFEDGNGRIHRYLIHHILAKKQFSHQGMIFPVSASILDKIDEYRKVLEQYSEPLLEFIEWDETEDHNIEVTNVTIDFYKYFDATKQAEFLYDCVEDTITNIIPSEITYLKNYDEFKQFLDNEFEMPDNTVALLVRFLEQNDGVLSKRAQEKEFSALSKKEVLKVETKFKEIFMHG